MNNCDKRPTFAKRAAGNCFLSVCVATFALGVATAPARAGTSYDETVSGDFSNDGLSPTALAFGLGSTRSSASPDGQSREAPSIAIISPSP